MSRSLNPRSAAEPALGHGPAGAPGSRASAGDIADEINDHLSCRREELEAAGVERPEAEQRARRSFGDVRKIARQLFWIHHGERIMSQRLLWAAIVLVFVALMANLYFQLRSAAMMNQAILRLTEQMGRSQQPMGEARIKVVDEDGAPRAGMNVTVTGVNPSPYLSNATYSRTFVSDAAGEIHTGRIPLGTYRTAAFISQTDPNNVRIAVTGAGFSLFDDGKGEEVTMTSPNLSKAKVKFEPPQVAGWTIAKYFEFESSERFGSTKIDVHGSADFGAAAELPLLPSAEVQVRFRLERHDQNGNLQTFIAVQTFARNDPVLLAGGTIQLDLPRDRNSTLTADGQVVSKHEAAHRNGE